MANEEDWQKKMREASAGAVEKANEQTQEELNEISAQGDALRSIAENLKLTDQETYDKLVAIVEEATRKNESIADVIGHTKALGEAGIKFAANISGGGGLAVLSSILKR